MHVVHVGNSLGGTLPVSAAGGSRRRALGLGRGAVAQSGPDRKIGTGGFQPSEGARRTAAQCRWHVARVMCWVLLLGVGAPVHAQVRVVDDTSHPIELAEPARRIVSLAPHITELLFAAGAGDRVVGVVAYSNHPPAARHLPSVGSYTGVDTEAILALRPDLVVGWQGGNQPAELDLLAGLGVAVYRTDPRTLADIPRAIRQLGQLAGTRDFAEAAARTFEMGLAALAESHRNARRVSVFYQVWDAPIMTVGGDHWISQIIDLCGGTNVFAALKAPTPTVSLEAVLATAPEVILTGGMGDVKPAWLAQWRNWPQLPAVRSSNLHAINPDWLQRAGPRLLDGARAVCAALDQARTLPPAR